MLFSKLFQKFFGPYFGTPGALAHYFRIPLLPLRVPIYFPDVWTSFLTSFFRGLRLLMIFFRGVRLLIIEPPDGGLLTTCCRILSLLCNKIYQSPRRHLLTMYGFHHTHLLKVFQNFLGPFWGPRGSCPLFSNSPSPATYPHIFSYVSNLSHFLLHGSA